MTCFHERLVNTPDQLMLTMVCGTQPELNVLAKLLTNLTHLHFFILPLPVFSTSNGDLQLNYCLLHEVLSIPATHVITVRRVNARESRSFITFAHF